MSDTGEHIGRICCPKCGNDDPLKIRYVEKIENYRQVLRVEDGMLMISSAYFTGEGYDDGAEPYFECHEEWGGDICLHAWPVPEWVQKRIEWV